MSRISSTEPIQQTANSTSSSDDGLRSVDMDEFLQLLITEMQNQDPLSPMENSEILQQISQIREIGATNELSDTLQSVLTGQNMATAGSLIGKHISALAEDGSEVLGIVDRVSIDTSEGAEGKRTLRFHVGDADIRMENIRAIEETAE